jgi:hypothetical protein
MDLLVDDDGDPPNGVEEQMRLDDLQPLLTKVAGSSSPPAPSRSWGGRGPAPG